MATNSSVTRNLEAGLILKTLAQLKARVHDRFPERGLDVVCGDLLGVAKETARRVEQTRRSAILVRIGVGMVLLAAAALAWPLLALVGPAAVDFVQHPRAAALIEDPITAMQAFESAVNLVILASLAIWFLISLEVRWKRGKILKHLHELRSFAHVVDMHQLTKDPVSTLNPGERLPTSPVRDLTPFQLARYLDYCVEMLSLIGKLAALYAEHTDDTQVVEASSDIEDLTTNLSRKIWQKIVVIGDVRGSVGHTPVA